MTICNIHGDKCDPSTDHMSGGVKFADDIEIYKVGNVYLLRVGGIDFPWAIAEGMDVSTITRDGFPGVSITILASSVRVTHALSTVDVDDAVQRWPNPYIYPEGKAP